MSDDRPEGLDLPIPPDALEDLLTALDHRFTDPSLVGLALTHRSWCAENPGHPSNERLEFLGDAVLGLVVSTELYERFPDASEGDLSLRRAEIVREPELAEMAVELGVGPAILLGRGEDHAGGRERRSILADTVEALIGAVHLDTDDQTTAHIVRRIVGDRLDELGTRDAAKDLRSRIHEEAARRDLGEIRYRYTATGPEHDPTFTATIHLDDVPLGEGRGHSKKQAAQDAARKVWSTFDPERGLTPAEEDSHG